MRNSLGILKYQYITSINWCFGGNYSICIKVIDLSVDDIDHFWIWVINDILGLVVIHHGWFFVCLVGSVEGGSEETTVDGGLVYDNGIFLVVPRETGDGCDCVDSEGDILRHDKLETSVGGEGDLRVVEDVEHRIHSEGEIRRVETHGLLTHGTLKCISWSLVVVSERNNRGADSQDHGGVNFEVGEDLVLLLKVREMHGYHSIFFLLNVQQLNKSVFIEIVEVWVVSLLINIGEFMDILFSNSQLIERLSVIVDNEEWSHTSS